MMKTLPQIADSWNSKYIKGEVDEQKAFFGAMDEYAKQMAVGFAEWCARDNNVIYGVFSDKWFYGPKEDRNEINIKELYQLYLKSLH